MKKVLLALGAVLILAAGGLWGFGLVAGRDVPLPDEAEFQVERPEVAPEDNAYTTFLEATNLLVETTNGALVADFLAGKTVDDGELRDLVAKNAECLALIRRGTECAICQMPLLESFDAKFPYLTSWLKIGKLLAIQSRLALLAGKPDEAAEAAFAVARMGDLVQKNAESMIHYLVGVSIASQGAEALLEWAGAAEASAELEKRAKELDGLGPFDAGLARALKAEARLAAGTIGQVAAGQIDFIDLFSFGNAERNFWTQLLGGIMRSGYFFQPHATWRGVQDSYRRILLDVSLPLAQTDLGDGQQFGQSWLDWLRPNAFGQLFQAVMMPAIHKIQETRCKAESMLAGARLAVACNRFAREQGRWPETLAELVPDFLSDVPRDPFDGEPFRYSAEKGIAWSVGKNLTDEGGSTQMECSDKDYLASRDRPKAEDFVFELR